MMVYIYRVYVNVSHDGVRNCILKFKDDSKIFIKISNSVSQMTVSVYRKRMI